MQTYRVTAKAARIPAHHLLRLTADQARRRSHALEAAGEAGLFRTLAPVEFKTGEEIGLAATDLPKAMFQTVTPAAPAKAVEAPARPTAGPARRGRP